MKTQKSSIVDELAEKYAEPLARAQKELKKARPKRHGGYQSDVMLFQKWAYRVGKGWYGFALGNVPNVWRFVLDEFLDWLEKQCPDFEIHQVKMKFRTLRFYVGTKADLFIRNEKINAEISQLQRLLSLPLDDEKTANSAQKKRKHSRTK